MTMILDFIKNHKIDVAFVAIIAILILLCGYFYLKSTKTQQSGVQIVKYEDSTNQDKMKGKLDIDDKTAGQIVKKIEYIHDGNQEPAATYYVQAPTIEKAAESTAESIKKEDVSLPAAATEKTDKTVVTANDDEKKVDVYKINLRNNHKVKYGALVVDNNIYPGAGYQAGRWEGNVFIKNSKKIKAGNIMYTAAQW